MMFLFHDSHVKFMWLYTWLKTVDWSAHHRFLIETMLFITFYSHNAVECEQLLNSTVNNLLKTSFEPISILSILRLDHHRKEPGPDAASPVSSLEENPEAYVCHQHPWPDVHPRTYSPQKGGRATGRFPVFVLYFSHTWNCLCCVPFWSYAVVMEITTK